METSNILNIVFGTFSLIGTWIGIYQFVKIKEGKDRLRKLQYTLAGINNIAIQKQISWQNQINTLADPKSQSEWEAARVLLRGRDDFQELVGITVALEGTISTDHSAIKDLMQKSIDIVKMNNNLQTEGLKNPNIARSPKKDEGQEEDKNH